MVNTTSWFNLWTWFKYINQDLNNVHNSADEVKKINKEKAETYIWLPIDNKELSDEEIDKYIDSLTPQQVSRFLEKVKSDEYDNNTLFAYIDNWDSWKNPFASWTWMFEKKKTLSISNSSGDILSNPVVKTLWKLAWWDVWFLWLEARWKHIYNRATPWVKEDAPVIVSNNTAEPLMDKIDERIASYSKKIKDLKAKWWNEEEIAKLERAYNQLMKQKNSRTTTPQQTMQDFVREEWYKGDNEKIASDLNLDKNSLWITDIEEKMAMSDAKFSRVDILKSLTREDFGVSESVWEKEYKPIIDADIKYYSNKWEENLLELHDWKNQIDNEYEYNALNEKVVSPKNNIRSRTQDKISDKIKAQLDSEYPWQWMPEKVTKYWKLKTAEKEFTKRLWKDVSKVSKSKNRLNPKVIEENTRWTQRWIGSIMEKIWKLRPTSIKNYLLKNKKLLALVWVLWTLTKNPAVQAWLTILEVVWDVDMAREWWNFIDDYRKFAPVTQRIIARLSSEPDTRIWWEFAWMTEEEKEKKYPLEEVKKDLEWLADNWYEDFYDTYFWWMGIDNGLDDRWDYFWWRLKNTKEKPKPFEDIKRQQAIEEYKRKNPWAVIFDELGNRI